MHGIETHPEDPVVALTALQLFRGMVLAIRFEQACKRQKSQHSTSVVLNHHFVRHCCGSHSLRYWTRYKTESSRRSRNLYYDNDMLDTQLLLPLNYDHELEPYI
jgi:hypothetical protein